MKKKLLVIGGGGHAKVVIDLALACGDWIIAGVFDDDESMVGNHILGHEVVGRTNQIFEHSEPGVSAIVAIGSNNARERLQGAVRQAGIELAVLVHPAATIAPSARLGAGTVVMAGSVVNPSAAVGDGVIVNTGSVIDHDCSIGDFCHIAPGASLCGGVSVGRRSLIGVGACVTPGVSIGDDCLIGAGAAVVRNVPKGSRAVGVPARVVN